MTITTSGGSFFTLLGILFVVLKLTKVVNWSWWIVLLPFWIWLPITLMILGIVLIVIVIRAEARGELKKKKAKKRK